MQGLFSLAFLIAVIVVFYWAWKNDKVGPNDKTTGLLRMYSPEEEKALAAATKKGGRGRGRDVAARFLKRDDGDRPDRRG